jgi:hypothetical protein
MKSVPIFRAVQTSLLALFCQGFAFQSLHADYLQNSRLAPDSTGGDRFGAVVAISGDTLVFSAPEYRSDGKFGAAYVYTRSASGWELQAQLRSPYSRPFATSIALDGDTLVVGGMEDRAAFGGTDAGLAFVYARDGGSWTLRQEIVTPDSHVPNRAATSVAVENGTLVVGVDSDATFGPTAGAAYVYSQEGNSWTFRQKLYASELHEGARFGSAADLSGKYLAIAANFDLSGRGAVHLFHRENSIWTEVERVVAPDTFTGAVFGRSIALNDEFLVVGRTDDNDAGQGAGAAYVFRLLPDRREFVQKLFAMDAAPFSAFGTSVGISGGTILVGAPSAPFEGTSTVGIVYAFEASGAGFEQVQRIVSENHPSFSGFGWSLAATANDLAVGSIFEDSAGVVYTFTRESADTVPPEITSAIASPSRLFPPNNKMVPVTLHVEAMDESSEVACRIINVAVDDPDSVKKDPAFEITGDLTVNLRAEKNSRGRSRTYEITVECIDAAGNASQAIVHVTVR